MQHPRVPSIGRPEPVRWWSLLERLLSAAPDFAHALSPGTAGALRGALLCALAAFALNCGVNTLALSMPPVTGDAVDYLRQARLMFTSGIPVLPYYWPPGSQLLLLPCLWLFGNVSDAPVHLYVAAVSGVTTGLLFLLTFTVSHRRAVAASAAAVYALTPTTIYLAWQPESHVFSALALVAFALCAVTYLRTGRLVVLCGAALAFGYAVLVRPGTSAMAPLCLALPLLRAADQHLRNNGSGAQLVEVGARIAVAASVIAVVIGPAIAHNYRSGAGFLVSINNERNFFVGNNPHTPAFKTGHLAWRDLESLPPDTARYLQAFYDAPNSRQVMLAEAWRFIRERPAAFVVRCVSRFLNYWTFDYEEGRKLQQQLQARGAGSWLPMLAQAAWSVGLVWLFLIASLALWNTRHAWLVAGVWLTALLYGLPHVLAFSSPVYRSGLHPLMALISALGLDHAAGLRGMRPRQAMATAMAWTVSDIQSHWALAVGYVTINLVAGYFLIRLA